MKTFKQLLQNKDTLIIDVRTPDEYREEHIPDAENIPVDIISTRIEDLKSRQKPIVVYCRSGARSGVALNILRQHGITDAYNGGGIGDMKTYLN